MASNPRLLILDEPTEGIQPSIIKDIERAIRTVAQQKRVEAASQAEEEREQIKDAIRTVAETGEVAILLVEQYYDFAQSLADQYLVMERGEIIARGAGSDMEQNNVRQLLTV